MELTVDIIIISILAALGLFLLILELFFLPGTTLAGICSLLFYGGAIYYGFVQFGTTGGYITILVSVLFSVAGIWWFMRSKQLDKVSLKTNIESVVSTSVNKDIQPGDEGRTLSRLNPMGTVILRGESVEAKALEDFIDEDTPVVVEQVNKTSVVVRMK